MTSFEQEPRFVSNCSDHENDETCRKKRCSDRYDSSESSDSGVVTSVSEDAFSTTNSDLLDLDSPRSNETLDSNEDSFTLSQDMAPNQGLLDKHESWRNKISWQEEFGKEMSTMDEEYHNESSNTLSQYFTQLLSRSQSKDLSKLDFSFSNDSDFLQFSDCSSSKIDSGIGTEESSESSQSSQRLSSESDDIHSCSNSNLISKPPPISSSKPQVENSCKIRFPATRNCTLNNNYVPPKNYVCKWKDCMAKYSIISNLVHHVQVSPHACYYSSPKITKIL
uniref:C2H2-type domain-containing protein n=1 Tax=Cacopsylla melanoneura TaxID=428564 RepID=A0A8D8QYS5_9HEMI